jgi:lipid-A-disaccharide synthase-like uncharacterized protein
MSSNQSKVPVTFWIVGVLGVLWNLAGIANFIFQVFFTDVMIAQMSEPQKELILNSPLWMEIVFGVATILGLLGSIGLIMRKRWATPALLVSLIAVVIQMGYSSFATDALEIMGQSPVFPAVIVLFSVILWWYAKRSEARGFLN